MLLPAAFCSANLIIYWGGFDTTWKLCLAMLVGLILFTIGAAITKSRAIQTLRNSIWVLPWLGGHVVIGRLGRYGTGSELKLIPDWVDIVIVLVFSLLIFYWAIYLTLSKSAMDEEMAKDAHQQPID